MRRLALLAALALAAPVLAAAPRPDAKAGPAKPFKWDVPMALETVEVPGVVEGQGLPMKLHAVRSKLGVPELTAHFLRAFAAAGLYVPPEGHVSQRVANPLLTALDPGRMINFTVIFQPNPDGTTTCILAESHLAERRPATGRFFAPVFPGGEAPVQSRVAERVQTLTYGTRAPEREVRAFYRDALKASGYQEVQPQKFRRGDDELTVHYEPRPGAPARVVVLGRPYVDEALQPAP